MSIQKRYAALALALCLLLSAVLTGCSLVQSVFHPADEEEQPVDSTAGFRRTVLYFQTDDGLMVPVMKLLPWEEGIGRAALNQLVDTDENRISAAAMGLKNVVPQGVSFVLSISDEAVATLNICDLPKLENAEAEQALVTAVVNTLTEIPTIEEVQLKFDGKVKKKLPHGTNVQDAMRAIPLNEEPLAVNASEEDAQHQLTLYYPNESASLLVPVTRHIAQEPDLTVAMQELVKGPAESALRNCFPEGTQVLSATMLDDEATINLSSTFASISDTPELEEAALQCIQLTARNFGAIASVKLEVEGKAFDKSVLETMAMPSYVNEFR
jgi:germination protein M